MLISDEWRELNALLHRETDAFGGRGHKWNRRVATLAKKFDCSSVLDYGCGKATLSIESAEVRRYDPAIPEFNELPEPADLVVCTDVLEHIEPNRLGDVLDHLQSLTMKAAFLVIGTRPSDKTMPDGRNAHLIIEPMDWWMPRITKRWKVLASYDSGEKGHWQDRGLKSPPLSPGREFSIVAC